MWNLFKKSKKEESKVLVVENNTTKSTITNIKSNYPKEVLEIHHEFHTAADKLLLEAKQIISEAASKNVSKVNRLESLGFKQAAQVTELKPLQQKAELSKEQLDSLAYYQLHYPNNKFITEEQVKIICHKYNLVCGDVSRFKGFVPEKNLKEIENFRLKDEDYTITGVCWGDHIARTRKTIPYSLFLKLKKDGNIYGKEKDLDINYKGTDQRYIPCRVLSEYGLLFPGEYFDRIEKESLKICAPVKDMDISGLELKEGYKLEKKHIPDPVVLQPVKNGYLILTAWGDEASDDLVVNQKFN